MMNKQKLHFLLVAVLIMLSNPLNAQKKSFTLNDLMSGGDNFWNLQPKNIFSSWWGDKLVETNLDDCSIINPANQQRTKLFTLDEINKWIKSDVKEAPVRSLYYVTFPDAAKTQVLINNGQKEILIDWKKKQIVWQNELPSGARNEDLSHVSFNEAYVWKDNLYVMTAQGKQMAVSTDGTRQLVYGQSVHRDEFGISKGTFWSPSGKLLAYYRMDQTMVKDYPMVDISTREAELRPEAYPMAGMTSHKVTVGIFNPVTGQSTWLQVGDPTDRYFTNISWAPDEKTIYMIELNRDQNHEELVAYDVATGAKKGVLYEERNAKYVHPMTGLSFLPWDSSKFILQSEKDGYNHLYLFDVDGKQLKQLTKGNFVVLKLMGFNTKTKSVVIRTTECSPLQNNFFAVNIETGKRTLLDSGEGVHSGTLSASGSFIADRWSSPKVTRKIDILSTTSAKRQNILNAADPWEGYNVPEITCGTLKAADDTTTLYYRMVKPVGFDPSKKYPTVVYVYGGPGLRNVEASRNYEARGWEIYMAQKGYLLFILDNRGSCDRGRAFEDVTFRHLGVEEMKDQMRGVDYLRSLAYVDTARLGVHGWSFGGFMTTNLMLTYPDVFKCAVAGGPVIDWKYYEVMYGERYMDTPQANPEGYDGSNLNKKAGNLKGRLEIIFGYNDPTCVPQHSLSFIRACEDAGTHPDLFIYPNQGHNMVGRDQVHLHEHITRYFEDHLKNIDRQ